MTPLPPPNPTNWLTDGSTFVTPIHNTYPFISSNTNSLHNRSVLITGASRGIGLQTAIHFARAGCSKIALAARSSLVEAETAVKNAAAETYPSGVTPRVLSLKMDITSPSSVESAAEEVEKEFGYLDILINNAGYLSAFELLGEGDSMEYLKTWNTNLNGTYLCTRYFLPLLLQSELKTIINVSSSGAHVLFPGASAYQTSKFALSRFTEFLDVEYAHQGLIAVAVHPGVVKTELADSMPDYMQAFLEDTVELSADTMVWLCKERREWLGGRFVAATWDMEELEGRREEIVQKDLLKFRMVFS